MLETILAVVGGISTVIYVANMIIRRSCLLANTVWELKRYGWKRIAREEKRAAKEEGEHE